MSDLLSIVIPVFNEQQSLEQLHGELLEVSRDQHLPMEIIFVDDGSQDESWAVIAQLAAADPAVRGIRFRRNFGKAAALRRRIPGGAGRHRRDARCRPAGRPAGNSPLPGRDGRRASTWSAAGRRSATIRGTRSDRRGFSTGWWA